MTEENLHIGNVLLKRISGIESSIGDIEKIIGTNSLPLHTKQEDFLKSEFTVVRVEFESVQSTLVFQQKDFTEFMRSYSDKLELEVNQLKKKFQNL